MSYERGQKNLPYFHEREIWWCRIGKNVGYEIDGKGSELVRPVLIVKKFNKNMVLVAPLTTSSKKRPLSLDIGMITGKSSKVMLDQIRTVDTSRMQEKMIRMNLILFGEIKTAIRNLIS